MTSSSGGTPPVGSAAWARAIGNPVARPTTFPFNPQASAALEYVPDGLVASPAVLSEFLNPPEARGDWFLNEAWQQASLLLRDDDGLTAKEYTDLIASFNGLLDALIAWTHARPDMTRGYAETLSRSQLQTMRGALVAIWDLNRSRLGVLQELRARDGVGADAKQALQNLSQVLWEYFQCMAFELEASHDQIAVEDVRARFEAGITDPWEPATTPQNVESGGISIGGQRLPPLPDAPGPEPTAGGDGSEPGEADPLHLDAGTGDPGSGDGGGGEE